MEVKNSTKIVVKSNYLINATYSLTVAEQRLLYACIADIDSRFSIPENKFFIVTEPQVRDLFFEDENKGGYEMLASATRRLHKREIEIKIDENQTLLTHWVQSCVFDKKTQSIKLKFTDEIIPYLSNLKEQFTKIGVKWFSQLTSQYSQRLFEYLCLWFGQQRFLNEFEVDEFRRMLGVPKNKYKLFANLRTRVIEVAVNDINLKTPFFVEIAYRRTGKFYTHVQIRFSTIENHSGNLQQRKKQNKQQKAIRLKKELEQAEQELLEDAIKAFEYLEDGTRFLDEKGVVFVKEGDYLRTGERVTQPKPISFIKKWYIDEKIQIIS